MGNGGASDVTEGLRGCLADLIKLRQEADEVIQRAWGDIPPEITAHYRGRLLNAVALLNRLHGPDNPYSDAIREADVGASPFSEVTTVMQEQIAMVEAGLRGLNYSRPEETTGTSEPTHARDFPELSFAVDQAFRQLEIDKVGPWVFLTAGKMQPIENFYGKTIHYSGVAFEGSPREVFWGGFIDPFLEAMFNRMFELASSYSRERRVDSREVIQHTRQRLLAGVSRIYQRMQDIDCRLRGKGNPRSVSPMNISGRIHVMEEKLQRYAESTLRGLDEKDSGPSERAAYVNESRLQQLRSLQSTPFDLRRLIQLCEELNHAWASGSRLSVLMLLRTVLNHVPPVFGQSTFSQVIGQTGGKSFKETMDQLDSFSRKLADEVVHSPITKRVDVPNDQRVDFRALLDRLLSEIHLVLDAKKYSSETGPHP